MKVSIAYASEQIWRSLDIHDEATVEDLILSSGLIEQFPIDLKKQKVGIYGKFTKLDTKLQEGDRVEIYQPITRVLDDEAEED